MKETLTKIMPIRKANSAYFYYRMNRWRWDARFRQGEDRPLDRPIYLIGTQGGGLTLLSRILHRHKDVISVTGDSSDWAGEDEAQNALEPVLPEDFGWRRIDLEGYPSGDHSWLYANDDFLPHYRRTADDAVPAVGARYRAIVGGIVRMHAGSRPARFVDKSQALTLRVGYVHALLADCDPRFVLITRNPYALVWSQATKNAAVSRLDQPLGRRVELCAQHWRNSYEAALADADRDGTVKMRCWQFEALLASPAQTVAEICAFSDLGRDDGILPGPNDSIPWGSRSDAFNRRKWYPLRTNVNDRYLSELPDWAREIIGERCGHLMQRFGYAI